MKPFLYSILVLLIVFSCKKEIMSAQEIVDQTIKIAGGKKVFSKMIDFDFRDKHYKSIRYANGQFQYVREIKDSTNTIKDVLSNNGFQRYINNTPIAVHDSMATKYSASINSVHYFAQLPYGLNDTAVNKSLLGVETIKDKTYYKIKITFNEEGGGEDFEDIFIYWIHKDTFKIDYLAYSYNEDDGLGLRFREAYNERYVKGIRFVDYNNYRSNKEALSLSDLGKFFEKSELKLLSKIETKNVVVNQLVNDN